MDLSASQVAAAAAVQFNFGNQVVDFFQKAANSDFIDWFNRACANKENWSRKSIDSSDGAKARFLQIWDGIPLMFQKVPIDLLQFMALMSAILIESGPELLPLTELCGCEGHPGIAYPFDTISGMKHSYNNVAGNRQAGDLFFQNDEFWAAHRHLPAAEQVRARPELQQTWNGDLYPQHSFTTSMDPALSGFIQQADFFKFRGRGLIQVTGRANYRTLVEYVQSYSGENTIVLSYKAMWFGKDPDLVCTISTNEDWDSLFQSSDMLIACRAVGIHNVMNGNYLQLASSPTTLVGQNYGSFYHVGLRINGSAEYAALFSKRVIQIVTALAYTQPRPTASRKQAPTKRVRRNTKRKIKS